MGIRVPSTSSLLRLHRRGLGSVVDSFHGPDEEDLSLTNQHLTFQPDEVFTVGDDEYRIHRKLRGRLTSMAWLASHANKRDPSSRSAQKKFVVLETFDCNYSTLLSNDRSNNSTLSYIHHLKAWRKEGARGSQYCDRSIRVLIGPYLVIVKEPTGPTLATLQTTQPNRSFTLPVTKRIAKHTLLALSFIHTAFGRTHTSINPHNLLVALQGKSKDISAEIDSVLRAHPPEVGHPSIWSEFEFSERTPVMRAQPLPPIGLSPTLHNLDVLLSRCEHATVDSDLLEFYGSEDMTAPEQFHAPLLLSAPEVLQRNPLKMWSPPINIWAVGHLVFQCLTGETAYTKRVITDDFHAFPAWDELENLCDPQALERRLRTFVHVDRELSAGDMQATCAFLSRCFEMDPRGRPTAKQLLEDEWFRS